MSVFDGIEHVAAEGTSLRQYFEPGNYLVTIDSVFLHERRLGGGKLLIVETTIDESDNPNIKAGEQRNWVQSFALPIALPRIKSFIGAAMGLCPSRQLQEINQKITLKTCEEMVSAENPLRGKKMKVSCHNKISQSGKEFTHLMWRPC
ncbi:hypothetical protein E6Q11_03765 [Candidatus Dojkabacteria bacterium]|uniref:DUF669 domain-containing protein n=1 Tax=Candidatus Dojkabacteria bacterium TaxID=2099670 RepID=A0A5C7J635_9BACT|nr:MAG: hypothetical protein E6Q11_03765 [Candidatus Dojkabacteria bacterium]